ncbi:hypothetical protein PR048_005245 [Dryococelus australis]|uniref:Uncharacterized protein n=1 Tax=Dryococelus australis TaxID=614101 RepID=A0ABQ9I7Q0_9NEOP|nr:hypothetical protein PR048_005245 [Dryococelus australis]
MFTVVSQHFRDMFLNVKHFTWNYHEAGHGKGAPYGLWGTSKRIVDNLVSQGKDIPDVATLISALKENIGKIIIEEVTKDGIDQMKQIYNFNDIKAFIGTMCSSSCGAARNINFLKEIQTVLIMSAVCDIIDVVLNRTIIKKGKIPFCRLGL